MRLGSFLFIYFLLFGNSCISQTRDLNFYVSYALSSSPLLKDYNNQALSFQIDSQRLKASYRPQVSASSANSYYPVVNGYGYDPVITNVGAYSALINVNQNFVGRKNLNAQYQSLSLQRDSVLNIKKISEQDLKRTITNQYISAYGDLQNLEFNQEVSSLLANEDSILKKLTENNIYRQTDYLTFLVTLKQQELQLKQTRIQFQTDYAQLNYLCGIYDTATVTLAPPDITLSSLPDLANSTFFKQYYIDSLKLQNEITILNYSYHPKADAFVNAGYYSSFLFEAYKNFGTGIGFNVNVPIYDGHQRKLQYNKIKLLEDTRINYKDFFTSQYHQQIAQLRQQLDNIENLIGDINEQIKYSKTLIDVNGKLMQTGDARISDFVIAINNYLAARYLLTQNTISRLQIINQINYWNR